TLNRLMEEKAAVDEDYRQRLREAGRACLTDGRALSDDELLARLHSLGLATDRDRFLAASRLFLSAQNMAEAEYRRKDVRIAEKDKDWVWIACSCLWERWQQDRPSLEMIDDGMQEGYQLSRRDDRLEACRVWLQVWRSVWGLIQAQGIRSLREYDDRFRG